MLLPPRVYAAVQIYREILRLENRSSALWERLGLVTRAMTPEEREIWEREMARLRRRMLETSRFPVECPRCFREMGEVETGRWRCPGCGLEL